MQVTHQPGQQRFVADCPGGPAVLEYTVLADGSVDFHHTWVPAAQRGSGIAAALVQAGLAWARAEGRPVHASCSYVQVCLER